MRAFNFGALSRNWDYFAQGMLQQPLNSRDGFRPGTGFNLNAGFRYVGIEHVVPSIQMNARIEGRESGANADVDNSGATLVYLSPGLNFQVVDNLHAYLYAQVPVYQRVNGLQLEPRYTVTLGSLCTSIRDCDGELFGMVCAKRAEAKGSPPSRGSRQCRPQTARKAPSLRSVCKLRPDAASALPCSLAS